MNSFGGTSNDKECFDSEIGWGIHLDNDSYVELFKSTAELILNITGAKTFTDFGGGMGAYAKAMKESGCVVTYYDLNPHHCDYVKERIKDIEIKQMDFTTSRPKEVDLMASIEVMEHITDDKLKPFLKRIKCKYFHFSSTPNYTDFDAEWGHINIKTEKEWIALFEECGFTLYSKIQQPTEWSLLFTK